MAEVFQFEPEGAASRGSLGASAASPTLGIRGGESPQLDDPARFLKGAAPDLSGGTSLPEFLDPLFAPKIQAEAAARFRQGYSEALMGKSQEDINKESPWYTRIFGPVPYQLGAAKYQVDKQNADARTYFVNELPRLRQLPTEEVVKEMNDKFSRQVAGDPFTTAMLNKSFMDSMPTMIDLHTKERYAWEQTDLLDKALSAGESSGAAFSAERQAYAKLGNQSPNDVESGYDKPLVAQNFLRSIAAPEHMNDETKKAYYSNLIRKFADNGNYDAISVMVEHGVDSVFTPEEVDSMRAVVHGKYNEFKDKTLASDPALLAEASKISIAAAHGLGGAATVADMQAFDQKWMALTGYLPYFSGADYLRMGVTSSNAAISNEEQARNEAEAAARQAAAAGNEALGKAQQIAFIRNAWMTGRGLEAYTSGMSKEDVNATVLATHLALAQENPKLAAQIAVNNFSTKAPVVPELARQYQQGIEVTTGGAWNPAFQKEFENWQALRAGVGTYIDPVKGEVHQIDTLAGPAAARAYFSDDIDDRLRLYEQQTTIGMAKEVAYFNAFGNGPSDRPVLKGDNKEETEAIKSGLRDVVSTASAGTWAGAFGTTIKPTASGRRFIERAIGSEYALFPNTTSSTLRLKNAALSAQRKGNEFHGRANWLNPEGAKTPRIGTYFGLSDDAITPAVDRAVVLGLRRVNFVVDDDSEIQIIRQHDEGGQPVLLVQGQDERGFRVVKIGRKEIEEAIKWDRTTKERLRTEAMQTGAHGMGSGRMQ